MSAAPAPARPARWWQKIICWTQGHNLIGVDLPEGFSWQLCRTCGQPTEAFKPPRPREPMSPGRVIAGLVIAAAVLMAGVSLGAALVGWLSLTGFLANLLAVSTILAVTVLARFAVRWRTNRDRDRT